METELGWEFIQIYGLTETAPLLTINRAPAEWDGLDAATRSQLLGRAGVPALGVRIDVDDEGEVLARSNHVFAGYWEQPDETAAALEGGWFHTGDGGYLDGAYLVISDRKKDVIITGGENVSSIEVEDCLYQHAAVAEVAVIGVPDEKWGETIKALVVVREGATVTEAELIAHCRDRLAHFKAPTSVELREALDRTATGKLQKYKLRQPYWEGREARQLGAARLAGSAPRDEVAAPVEGGGDLAGDEPAQRVSHDGAPPPAVEPAGLAAEKLRDVGPGGQEPLVEVEVVGDLAHHARADGHGGRRGRRVAALRGHPDLLRRPVEAALDGLEDLGGTSLGQVPAVDAAGAAQLVPVAGRPLREGQEPEVGEHHAPGPVATRPRCAPARPPPPARRRGAPRHAPDVAELPPGLLGDAGRGAVAQHLVALVEGPLQPAEGVQPLGEHDPQLQQVGDVVDGVGELASDIGRSSQSESRSALGRETPSIGSTSRTSEGVDMPRNPATIWVSNTVAGTVPQAAMSTSRSCEAACATATPGPPNTRASGAGSTARGSTSATLSAQAIWMSARSGT